MIIHQRIHDNIRPGTPVKDIPHQVHLIHGHAFDELTDLRNEVRRLPRLNDGGDDVFKIIPLVDFVAVGVEQLLNDIGVILRQGLADLRAGVLGGHQPGHLSQPVQGDAVPFLQVGNLLLQLAELFLRIVDQRCQLIQIGAGEVVSEKLVQFFPHNAGAGI